MTHPSRNVWISVVSIVLVVAATACGGADGNEGSDTGISIQDPALVAQGDPLYQASCSSCHGSDLRGTELGPSHLSIVYEPNHHGDEAFVVAVRAGVRQHHWTFGKMAPVDGLSNDDITAIIAFVRENQRIEGFEPYPP